MKMKRTIAGWLSALLVGQLVLSGSAVEARADGNAVIPANMGQALVEEEAKYLGYSYSQTLGDRKGGAPYYNFDCSGLVDYCMGNLGFATVPDNTLQWLSGIYDMGSRTTGIFTYTLWYSPSNIETRVMTYHGQPVVYVAVNTAQEFMAAMKDPANIGKMVILKNPTSYQAMADMNAFEPGCLVLYPNQIITQDTGVREMPRHIATIAGTTKINLDEYIQYGKDYPASLGVDLSYTYNLMKYTQSICETPWMMRLFAIANAATGVVPQPTIPKGIEVETQKNIYFPHITKGLSWPKLYPYSAYEEVAWSNYGMGIQPVFRVLNYAKKTDNESTYAAKGYYGLLSHVWKLEALNESRGVTLTNNAEGMGNSRTCYVMGFPTNTEPDDAELGTSELPFWDVPMSAWYYEPIRVLYNMGIVSGTSVSSFSPNGQLTRGQVVTMLWNKEGHPYVKDVEDTFPDVDSQAYYAKAVKWAKDTGIVHGMADGTFRPGDPVTRQDFAIMLRNYAAMKGYDKTVTQPEAYLACVDAGNVGPYAIESVAWCFEKGLIGSKGELLPKKTISRSETASMLQRYLLHIEQKWNK